jgi:hypothetical protein
MLASIRKALFQKALRQLLARQKRQRKVNNLESAHSIGLAFDATDEKIRKEVLEIYRSFEKNGKKIKLLGFFNVKETPGEQPFDFFFKKEMTWTGQPKSPVAETFANAKPDVLICLNPEALPILDWIAIQSAAAMKIGMATDNINDYDLQLEIPKGKGPRYFMEQLSIYLDKIVLTRHEPARAS